MNGEIVMADSRFDVLVYLFFGVIWVISQILNARSKSKGKAAARQTRAESAARTIRTGPAEAPPPVRPVAKPAVPPEEELRRFFRELAGGGEVGETAESAESVEPEFPPVVFQPVAPPAARRITPAAAPARPVASRPIPAVTKPVPVFSLKSLPATPLQSVPLAAVMPLRGGPGRPARHRIARSRAALREAFVWKTLLEPPLALRPPNSGAN
jgi:hypothetical protein